MMSRTGLALLGLCFTLHAVHAAEQQVIVPSGKAVPLAWYGFFNRVTCSSTPAETTVTKKPEHGTVTFELSSAKITKEQAEHNNVGACAGKPVHSRVAIYRANPGFKGQDSFTVRFSTPRNDSSYSFPKSETFIVTVR